MKKIFALFLLIPFALVWSCEKQESTAEQKLAQRKTELDAREKALDEREKALAERQILPVKPRVAPVPRTARAEPRQTVPPDLQGLMDKLEELQRRRVPGVPRQTTAPVTDQAGSPSASPTPE
jgi:hypothetical protein